MLEHVAMLASMLAAMLLRPAEYSGGATAAVASSRWRHEPTVAGALAAARSHVEQRSHLGGDAVVEAGN